MGWVKVAWGWMRGKKWLRNGWGFGSAHPWPKTAGKSSGVMNGSLSASYAEQSPRPRDALEVVLAAVIEGDTRSSHQVHHGAGHQHLPRRRAVADAYTNMDG